MNSITLYLVDNCLLSRISTEIYLLKNKFSSFEIFDNAKDCLSALGKKPAEVIISDIDLPVMDGIETTKIIKEKFPQTKVIIYTTREDEKSILTSLSNGACAYVLKHERKSLKNIIEKILKNEFYMDLKIAKSTFSKIPISNIETSEKFQENKIKERLTKREIEVLKLLTAGKTNMQIAREIVVSTNTAKAHVGSIFSKLSVKDRVQAAVIAVKANIL